MQGGKLVDDTIEHCQTNLVLMHASAPKQEDLSNKTIGSRRSAFLHASINMNPKCVNSATARLVVFR